VLLAERVVACWLLVGLPEASMSAQLNREAIKRSDGVPASFVRELMKMQEGAQQRYLSAIEALARVRRLQATTPPAVQVNTQVNLLGKRRR
jgi:hypothetical protein